MASSGEVFNSIVKAQDETTPILQQIERQYEKLGAEIHHVEGAVNQHGHAVRELEAGHRAAFEHMGEHVHVLREHFGELKESAISLGEHFSELVPELAALGAGASVVGVFESVARTAESYGELAHQSAVLGTSVEKLQAYAAAAKLADIDITAFQKSAVHLNRVMGEVAGGGNRDAAALFRQLHINPASFHDATEAMVPLADAFQHTTSQAMRTRMAFALFGKSGAELIPFLAKGSEGVGDSLKEAGELIPDFRKHGKDLEHYNESLKGLKLASGGLVDQIGAEVAPALDPLMVKLRDYLTEHRDEISHNVGQGVLHASEALEHVNFDKVEQGLDRVGSAFVALGDHIQAVEWAVEGLAGVMALKGVMFLGKPIVQLIQLGGLVPVTAARISGELVTAWREVRGAALAAGEAELAAGEAGAAAGAGGKVKAPAAGASRWARVAGSALAFVSSWPVAGGIIAHELDAEDASGKWVDRNFAWAANADDWVSRHTGGWIGRSHDDNAVVTDLPARFLTPSFDAEPDYAEIERTLPARSMAWSEQDIGSLLRESRGSREGSGVEPARGRGEVEVIIRFENAPPRTFVETRERGDIGHVRVNLGKAWEDEQ